MKVGSKIKKSSVGKALIAIYILAVLAISANARASVNQMLDLKTELVTISK